MSRSKEINMGGQASPISFRWRPTLRFSVRGLIILVLVIGLWLGWLVRCARIQRDAVAAIQHAGGKVAYDWEWRNGKSIPGGKPWTPRWLIDLIGVDYFGHVTFVWLIPSKADDAAIAQVGRLIRLQLKDLTRITVLWLDRNQVTDAGLAHLRALKNLTSLSLVRTQVTDAGLVHLKGLTDLSELNLSGTAVTDLGLAHLKGLTNLSVLDVMSTQVTDAGVSELRRTLPNPNLRIYR